MASSICLQTETQEWTYLNSDAHLHTHEHLSAGKHQVHVGIHFTYACGNPPTAWTQMPMYADVCMLIHNQLHGFEQAFMWVNIHTMQDADT